MPTEIEMCLPDRFWKSRAEAAEAEVERLRALLQHPQIHNDGTVRWFGRILKEQTNQ